MLRLIVFLVVLVLMAFALRYQLKLALGIIIGLVIGGGLIGPFLGPYNSVEEIPVWLPPTPFIFIVTVLFSYAFVAWYVLDYKANKTDS